MAMNSHSSFLDGIKEAVVICFLLFLVSVAIIATISKHSENPNLEATSVPMPANSIVEAQREGIFVDRVQATPQSFRLADQPVIIEEAWLEEITALDHKLVWYPYRKHVGYRLCVKLSQGTNALASNSEAYLLLPEIGSALVHYKDSKIFTTSLENSDKTSFSVELIQPKPKLPETEESEDKKEGGEAATETEVSEQTANATAAEEVNTPEATISEDTDLAGDKAPVTEETTESNSDTSQAPEVSAPVEEASPSTSEAPQEETGTEDSSVQPEEEASPTTESAEQQKPVEATAAE